MDINQKLEKFLLRVLRVSGEALFRRRKAARVVAYKGPLSLVTQVDKAIEKEIIKRIRRVFPSHDIVAEESPPKKSGSDFCWYIDPIDGTTNYAHGLPHACVSVGISKNSGMLMGGIYDPFKDELFFAKKGSGAFLNGKRITVSKVRRLRDALLVTGFPYDRKKRADFYMSFYKKFMTESIGIRRFGSAALDLCYVACGRFDGFWEFYLSPWDVAAGMLIVEEAGGKITDFHNGRYRLSAEQTLATNGRIHKEMLKCLKKAPLIADAPLSC